ncbi:MAG: DUF561 domain-containing protein [Vampirovibrionales bacterium]|nr:DUF561 domain-containing protein [Vampirovibrionales bacterium]
MHLTETTRANRVSLLKFLLAERQLLKGIAGIAETRWPVIETVIEAANQAGQPMAIDITAEPAIVKSARARTHLPLFASAVTAEALVQAALAGADALELGNYDALYEAGEFIDAVDVLTASRELLFQLKRLGLYGRVLTCVTIPGHLALDSQVNLALALEAMGVDMLQSEGAVRQLTADADMPKAAPLTATEKVASSLRAVRTLAAAVRIPVMAASGFEAKTAQSALEAGASAVGVGRSWRLLGEADVMAASARDMLCALRTATMPALCATMPKCDAVKADSAVLKTLTAA